MTACGNEVFYPSSTTSSFSAGGYACALFLRKQNGYFSTTEKNDAWGGAAPVHCHAFIYAWLRVIAPGQLRS